MADLQTCGGARQHEGVSTAASHGRRVFIAGEPRDRHQTRQAAAVCVSSESGTSFITRGRPALPSTT